MAAYIDHAYYRVEYMGRPVDVADFPRLALRASQKVDALTFNRAARNASLPEVKQATCAIVEGLATLDAYTDGGVVSTSESATGAYSYTIDAGSVTVAYNSAVNAALAILAPTGMLYAGVGC